MAFPTGAPGILRNGAGRAGHQDQGKDESVALHVGTRVAVCFVIQLIADVLKQHTQNLDDPPANEPAPLLRDPANHL